MSEQVLDELNQSTAKAQVEVVRVYCALEKDDVVRGQWYGVEEMGAGAVEECLRVYRAEE
jgi:hypothetical protein